jgi:hypothetical protein
MKTFLQWAEENKYDLPVVTDTDEKKDATSEGSYRRRIKFGHPDAEGAAQYPQGYFAPGSATAFLDFKQRKEQKMKKDTGGTAAN